MEYTTAMKAHESSFLQRISYIFSIFIFAAILFSSGFVSADEIVLQDGKTMKGKIVGETKETLTIQSGKSMVFTIDKSKIKKVNRTETKPKGPTITLEDVTKKKVAPSTAAPSMSLPTSAKNENSQPIPSPIYNLQEDVKMRRTGNKEISLEERFVTRNYKVKGSTQSQIAREIYDADNGKGFLGEKGRLASKTQMTMAWTGKMGREGKLFKWETLTIQSTMTATFPFWEAPPKPNPELAKTWTEFLKAVETHTEGELKIYSNALASFGQGVNQLRSSSEIELKKESYLLQKQVLDRVEKQKAGFNRVKKVDWEKIFGMKS